MLDPRSAFAEASANGGDGNTKLLGQLSVRGASFAAVTQLGECLRFSQTSFAARPTELDAYVDQPPARRAGGHIECLRNGGDVPEAFVQRPQA